MNKQKTFIFLSGLPRSGSTLLSAILSQNPDIHSEGNSAMSKIMWDILMSCGKGCAEQLAATGRQEKTPNDIISAIPGLYYKEVDVPFIVDKCRTWTIEPNFIMRKHYMGDIKTICLERSIVDIVKSFKSIAIKNNVPMETIHEYELGLIRPLSDPIMNSLFGLNWAKRNNDGSFIFITYDELISNTEEVIDRIYKFCNIPTFKHDFNNIINKHPEDDTVYNIVGHNMVGLHEIRPTISRREINVELSPEVLKRCIEIDNIKF